MSVLLRLAAGAGVMLALTGACGSEDEAPEREPLPDLAQDWTLPLALHEPRQLLAQRGQLVIVGEHPQGEPYVGFYDDAGHELRTLPAEAWEGRSPRLTAALADDDALWLGGTDGTPVVARSVDGGSIEWVARPWTGGDDGTAVAFTKSGVGVLVLGEQTRVSVPHSEFSDGTSRCGSFDTPICGLSTRRERRSGFTRGTSTSMSRSPLRSIR